MALRKLATVLLMEIFVVLPIILEARNYHGYGTYREFYHSQIAGEHPRPQANATTVSGSRHKNTKGEVSHLRGSVYTDESKDVKSNFVFPKEYFRLRERIGDSYDIDSEIDPVPRCEGQTFCEDVDYYPTELVNEVLARDPSLMHYSSRDAVDTTIAHRIDPIDELLPCNFSERLIFPKTSQRYDNEWMYIFQSAEANFSQGIRVETCTQEGSECKTLLVPGQGYVTSCKQKYIYRQLSAITKEGKMVRDFFRFPASCCCHVYFSRDDK